MASGPGSASTPSPSWRTSRSRLLRSAPSSSESDSAERVRNVCSCVSKRSPVRRRGETPAARHGERRAAGEQGDQTGAEQQQEDEIPQLDAAQGAAQLGHHALEGERRRLYGGRQRAAATPPEHRRQLDSLASPSRSPTAAAAKGWLL